MLFISTKHNTVLQIHQRGLAGNFNSSILTLLVVSEQQQLKQLYSTVTTMKK